MMVSAMSAQASRYFGGISRSVLALHSECEDQEQLVIKATANKTVTVRIRMRRVAAQRPVSAAPRQECPAWNGDAIAGSPAYGLLGHVVIIRAPLLLSALRLHGERMR